MPIDRERRDRLAAAMIGVLRGEVELDDLDNAIDTMAFRRERICAGDPVLERVVNAPFCAALAGGTRLYAVIVRAIALLRSDLENVRTRTRPRRPSALWITVAVGYGVAAGLGLAAWRVDPFLLLVPWLLPLFVSGVAYWAFVGRHRERAQKTAMEFNPFDDEAQWRACQPLLAGLDVPSFETARLRELPTVDPERRSLLASVGLGVVCVLGGVLMVALMLAVGAACILGVMALAPLVPAAILWPWKQIESRLVCLVESGSG